MRALGCRNPRTRNESEGERLGSLRWDRRKARTINRSGYALKDLSQSMPVGTRKTVIFARAERSQRKLWWKFVAILTCKSFV